MITPTISIRVSSSIFHANQQKVFYFIGPALGPLDPILWTAHTEACIHSHGATLGGSAPDVTISTPVNPRPKLTNLRGSQPTLVVYYRLTKITSGEIHS